MVNDPLQVLFLSGAGRSGTTLVGRLLGQRDRSVFVGEASQYLFNERMQERLVYCSCGAPVVSCEFWRPLVHDIDPSTVATGSVYARLRHLPGLLAGRLETVGIERLRREMTRTLQDVADRAGADCVVDSSKNPATAAILLGSPELEVRVVHLVRDGLAVVESWSRAKGYLRAHNTSRSAALWVAQNLGAERVGRRAEAYTRVRLEDFLAAPRATVATIEAGLGIERAAPSRERAEPLSQREGQVYLEPVHALAGNPERSAVGWTELRPPKGPPDASPWAARVLCAPLRKRYGYPLGETVMVGQS